MTWKPDIVIYHGGCDDGFGAAWACWKKWGDAPQWSSHGEQPTIEYVGMRYGDKLPKIEGKHVLFVDFSLKRDAMIEAVKIAKSIIVLDHHKTAEAELAEWRGSMAEVSTYVNNPSGPRAGAIAAVFDMDKSGARLAWEFCHPNTEIPALILRVEDRDLWRFKYPDTHAISAAIRSYPYTFEQWDKHSQGMLALAEEGAAISRAHQVNVQSFAANAYKAKIGGYQVPVINVPYHYASDAADYLMKNWPNAPFAAAWFRRGDGTIQYSLRSRDDRVDVSEIAKKYGGGGHRNAAGFQVPAA